MGKYIIFRAEKRSPNWKERKLQHTQALTDILAEYYDCSDKPIPAPGYRPLEFIRVDAVHDSQQHGYSTHYRPGDWEVTQVQTYTPDLPTPHSDYDMIVICHCRYNPIDATLKPMPERQVSLASFGGDKQAYESWLESQKQTK
jgi:hypothetical protein